MSCLSIGYLFKKRYITYQEKQYEIFEFLDYVSAISFTNTSHNERCNVLSGNYTGKYASRINKDANEEEYVFLEDSLSKAIEDNKNSVNFIDIRNNRISKTSKYYLRGSKGDNLTQLVNNELIKYLESESQNNKSDFDEGEFEKNTDISSMYSSISNV